MTASSPTIIVAVPELIKKRIIYYNFDTKEKIPANEKQDFNKLKSCSSYPMDCRDNILDVS